MQTKVFHLRILFILLILENFFNLYNLKIMDKKVISIIIKVLIYALGLIGSALGISALTSCSSSRAVECHGKTTILIQDTTTIQHSSDYFRNFKYRY